MIVTDLAKYKIFVKILVVATPISKSTVEGEQTIPEPSSQVKISQY
jgi:hypothetical protein